jgi:hypothetical protein
MEMSVQRHATVTLLPAETPVHIEQEIGWAPQQVWYLRGREKYLALTEKSNPVSSSQ